MIMKKDPAELIWLEPRAEWLAWRYELDKERVLKILERLEVKIEYVIECGDFAYLEYSPCLETALWYFRPNVAMKLFETADLESIRKLLSLMTSINGMHTFYDQWVEERCRLEVEQYAFPD